MAKQVLLSVVFSWIAAKMCAVRTLEPMPAAQNNVCLAIYSGTMPFLLFCPPTQLDIIRAQVTLPR